MRPSNVELVRTLWQAHREGRVDDLLQLLDTDVVWCPLSQLSQPAYRGHDDVRAMLDEIRAATGLHWIDLDEVVEPEPDLVRATGRVVTPDVGEGPVTLEVAFVFALHDGLVQRVDTYAMAPTSSNDERRRDS